jgi:hypothetical protein
VAGVRQQILKAFLILNVGEYHYQYSFKRPVYRSGLNATEVTSYQYLGMTKIAGALNMLPKKILKYTVSLFHFKGVSHANNILINSHVVFVLFSDIFQRPSFF